MADNFASEHLRWIKHVKPQCPHKTIRKITCLGSGFVGGPTSAVTAFKTDVAVTVVDINSDRIAAWQSDSLPIYEPGLFEIVHVARDGIKNGLDSSHDFSAHREDGHIATIRDHNDYSRRPNLFFSTDVDQAIEDADLIFVCVNTPTKSTGIGKGAAADLGFVETATRNIAKVATTSKLVVEKSTVPCRTAQYIREILSANARPGVHFEVLSNPEFLAEGTAVRDLLDPDRIIIGSMQSPAGHGAAASLAEVYAQWIPRDRIITMNLWSSELSKLAANAMLAQRISSVNALSAICEATGAEVDEVSYACGLDSRIGPKMLKAGPGFGGSCFQKDIFNIVYLSESLHLYEVAEYWRSIIKMNEYQKLRFTKRIIACLFHNLYGKKIAVLGFAFKKDTSDTRESPAITLVSNFVAEKAQVAIYDPQVKERQIWMELVNDGGDLETMKQNVTICSSAYEACANSDAVVIVTEWDEFSNKTDIPVSNLATIANPAPSPFLQEIMPNRRSRSRLAIDSESPVRTFHPISPTNMRKENRIPSIGERLEGLGLSAKPPVTEPQRLDWARIARDMRKPRFVFDGRGILDAAKLEMLGFRVEAIGRASSLSEDLT